MDKIKNFIYTKINKIKEIYKNKDQLTKKNIIKMFLYSGALMFVVISIMLFISILYFSVSLPDHETLKNYNPPITTRLYSADGRLLKEYAKEKRLFIPITQIPDVVKNAFITAEDDSFYENMGVNPKAIIVAAFSNLITKLLGRGQIRGGSTITQQVAKNFFLTREKTITRKIKEAMLSIRITQTFSKDKILELYLNQIFLGNRAYGVGSAAVNYFNKALDELTIEEAAMLAALPKAPAKLDPTRNNPTDILERRNWIIERMYNLGYITKLEKDNAINTPINLKERSVNEISNGEFFSEEVRKEFVSIYDETKLLEGGNSIFTTLDTQLQELADKYLKEGIEAYDVKHGFRGPLGNINIDNTNFKNDWGDLINNYEPELRYRKEWNKAVVLDIDNKNQQIIIGLGKFEYDESYKDELENNDFVKSSKDDKLLIMGYIPLKNLKWARKYIDADKLGESIKKVSDVELSIGDVIVVEKDKKNKNEYFLRQIPAVNGALLAMNPHNGKIVAMMGGYIDSVIDFNRATQAERQTGSIAKPFAYLTALENGWTPASMIMDEEITLNQGDDKPPYTPKNIEGNFYGPTTLRVGLEKSRNVATVRLTFDVGLKKVTEMIKRFGITDKPKQIYSIALGSMESSLLKMVRAYAMIVNGGKNITPSLIEKIENKDGELIFQRNTMKCINCEVDLETKLSEVQIPVLIDNREQIIDQATAYQMTSLLEGVVQRGTGWRAKSIGKTIGGKTGTTNESNDAWFIGFSPDLVVGVYVGFDKPSTLGRIESGSSIAGPIFVNFMYNALKEKPSIPFRVPENINLIRIDTTTGYYPTTDSEPKNIVLEAFKEGDKITKFFEQDASIENINEYIEAQGGRQRPVVVTNVEFDESINQKMKEEIEANQYNVEIIDEENAKEEIKKDENNNKKIYKLKKD